MYIRLIMKYINKLMTLKICFIFAYQNRIDCMNFAINANYSIQLVLFFKITLLPIYYSTTYIVNKNSFKLIIL